MSTAAVPKPALKWAFGGDRDAESIRSADLSHSCHPRATHAGGVYFKRPVFGMVSLCLIPPEALVSLGAQHVLRLHNDGACNIIPLYLHAHEIVFPAMVPGEYHDFTVPVRLPDFTDKTCPEHYQRLYGLTNKVYARYRTRLRQAVDADDAEALALLLSKLQKRVVEFLAPLLVRHARARAAAQGYRLCFLNHEGKFAADPPGSAQVKQAQANNKRATAGVAAPASAGAAGSVSSSLD